MTAANDEFRHLLRAILVGGGAAGVLSILPLVNLLNLLFLFWILLGAALSVHRFMRFKPQPTVSDALLLGAGSGLVAGTLFALLGAVSVMNLSEERLSAAVERASRFFPEAGDEILPIIQNPRFKVWLLLALCGFVVAATIAGTVGGLVSRLLLRRRS